MAEELKLVLPEEEKKEEVVVEEVKVEEPVQEQELIKIEDSLTEEERQQVEAFSKQIDITNTNVILNYAGDAQKKIADFSDGALENVRTKDLGTTGDMLADLVGELKSFDAIEEESKGFFLRNEAKIRDCNCINC